MSNPIFPASRAELKALHPVRERTNTKPKPCAVSSSSILFRRCIISLVFFISSFYIILGFGDHLCRCEIGIRRGQVQTSTSNSFRHGWCRCKLSFLRLFLFLYMSMSSYNTDIFLFTSCFSYMLWILMLVPFRRC
jgi:hypothetical protein